jgi:hypothetical protein
MDPATSVKAVDPKDRGTTPHSASNVPRLETLPLGAPPAMVYQSAWSVDLSFVPFLVKKNTFFLNKFNQGVSFRIHR